MGVALAIATYMLLDPAPWVYDLMDLTPMSNSFKGLLVVLGFGGFAFAYAAEGRVFPQLSIAIGRLRARLQKHRGGEGKKRKEYKVILESMRI